MKEQPVKDLVIVVPGILGSRLVRNSRQIWGPAGVVRNLLRPDATLALTGDGHDVDPSVRPDGLVRAPVHFPGLAKVNGYDRLVKFLREQLTLGGDNLLVFAYDWRLSNEVNGRLLAQAAFTKLEYWRNRSGNPDAKLILVCHSMGGLVARAFLDLEDGAPLCRRLITVGTPYFGTVKALGCLVNGVYPWSGRIGEGLTELARTWPSVYELLPSYPAIVGSRGDLASLGDIYVPELDRQRLLDARTFHSKLRSAVKARQGQPPAYDVTAVIGHLQPTYQFARVTPGSAELLTEHNGVNLRGDGTVPRQGACPLEWDDDGHATFEAQTHLSLPGSGRVLRHLLGVVTAVPRPPMAVRSELSVDVRELVLEGEPFEIAAETTAPRLALAATVVAGAGGSPVKRILEPHGHRQVAVFDSLPPGTYLVTVGAAARSVKGVESVSDALTIWPKNVVFPPAAATSGE